MEVSISIPIDDDGFLRRQCPRCGRVFKWHHGPTPERPDDFVDPPLYYCPYCGSPAGHDEWFTEEQREYMLGRAAGPAMLEVTDALERIARSASGSFLKVSVRSSGEPEPPVPLVEPNDMTAVASPCHPWEPVKVADEWQQPLHCLVCGEAFAVQ